MEYRPLGKTGLNVSALGFGASSLGAEFRSIDIHEAMRSVRVALDLGMNLIDSSPFYGRGMSEVLLGIALRDVPRDRYLLSTKLGRYDVGHFDFSAKRVEESIDVSLHRLRTDHLDIILCHDIEFVDLNQIVEETLPAVRRQQQKGKVKFVGISGYPMNIFKYVLERADLDVILSYNHYTLQNTMLAGLVPLLKQRGVGAMNAAPFSARLLTKQPLPKWHKATEKVRKVAAEAAAYCERKGVDIAQLAVQYSVANKDLATCIIGSANPENVRKWVQWADHPMDQQLVADVLKILQPIHDWYYIEGRPENNDSMTPPQV